jgi:hypothetical protein
MKRLLEIPSFQQKLAVRNTLSWRGAHLFRWGQAGDSTKQRRRDPPDVRLSAPQ